MSATKQIEYRIVHGGTIGASWYTVDRRVDSSARDQWVPVPARGGASKDAPPRINPGRFRFSDFDTARRRVDAQVAADRAAAHRIGMGVTVASPESSFVTVSIFF